MQNRDFVDMASLGNTQNPDFARVTGNRKLGFSRVETMYFQHNPIVQNLALKTCGLDAPPTRDFRHTQRALGCLTTFSKNVLHGCCTNT